MLSQWSGIIRPAASPYGPELVVNGGFDTATDWTGANWTISGGTANAATAATIRVFINTTGGAAEIGATYRFIFTITSFTSGSITPIIGGTTGTTRTAAGTYTEDIVATTTNQPTLRAANNTTASCDNVSVKKVL